MDPVDDLRSSGLRSQNPEVMPTTIRRLLFACGAPQAERVCAPLDRPRAPAAFDFVVVAALILITAFSLGRTPYGMVTGDAAGQVPLALHVENSALLNQDPIVAHYGAQYKSLFLLAAAAARTRFRCRWPI